MAPPQVVQWVRRTYPKPRVAEEWLDACCAWLVDDMNINPDTQTDEFIMNVETQLLESNLSESMVDGTGFPLNAMTMNNARIGRTPILVEVTSITEIGHSAFNLHNTRQMRIERADLAGLALEEGAENDEGLIPNYPHTMLKLEVCDGSVTLPAIEYRALPELKLGETPLGFKILIKNVLIRKGVLFLEPDGIVLKGHKNDDRDEFRDRDFVHGLYKRLCKPVPPVEANGGENDPPGGPPPAPPANPPPGPAAHPAQARSPLREISEPPDAMDIEDDAELPRKRRIPNPPAPSTTLASSSGSTLVASRFFAGSAPAPSPTCASSTGGGSASSTIRVLSHMLSPARGEPIDLEDSSMEDLGPEPVPSPAPVRSAAASGKQKQPARGKGGTLAAGGSFDEFDFGSDGDIDADFLAEVERAEQAALGKMQAQARETSRPKLQTSGSTRTPVPARTPVSRPQASQAQSQSKSRTQPQPQSQRAPTQPKPIPQDVITIEDDEEDDKENVPVPKRRVRRRISTMPDDVIDLSD